MKRLQGASLWGVLAALALQVAQAAPVKTAHAQAELLSEASSVRPGQPFTLGLKLTPDPGWHTYWINPGDAGKAAQLRWDAPEALEFGELEFPAPGFVPFMGMMSYGYNEPTLLLVDVAQTAPVAGDALLINARASWLVCDDQLCVPERANLALEIPLAGGGAPAAGSEDWRVAAFAEARALLPQPAEWPAAFHESNGEVVFELATPLSLEDAASLYLFPEAAGMIDHTAAQQVDVWPGRVRVAVPSGPRVARYEDTGLVLSMAMDGAPRQAFSLLAQRSEGPAPAEDSAGAAASLIVPPGGDAVAGVHADQQTSVASLLPHLVVAPPLVMGDPLAIGMQFVGDERIKGPALARTVAIDDDYFRRTRGFGPAHGRVDFFRIELPALLKHRGPAADLLPHNNAAYAFHVGHDQYAHYLVLLASLECEPAGKSWSAKTA